jgi:hypothetical protein
VAWPKSTIGRGEDGARAGRVREERTRPARHDAVDEAGVPAALDALDAFSTEVARRSLDLLLPDDGRVEGRR